MSDKTLNIIFMGTPDFAVPSLKVLVENGYNVVGVITAPDRPAGRGQQLKMSAVKEYAEAQGLNILQPNNLKSPEFTEELKALKPDLAVVVAFRMLPEVVWQMPSIGTFNLHASLLPQYRGAAPINWAIMNGEEETGLTTFFLQHEIDTGNILLQEKVAIGPDETAGELHDKLMDKGAGLVLKTVQLIESGEYEAQPQELPMVIKHAPKIFREDCEIDWEQDVNMVYNFIRGLSPYPAAHTYLQGKLFKILEAEKTEDGSQDAGAVETDNKTYLRIYCDGGYLDITELQMEGKRRMATEDFLRGFDFDI